MGPSLLASSMKTVTVGHEARLSCCFLQPLHKSVSWFAIKRSTNVQFKSCLLSKKKKKNEYKKNNEFPSGNVWIPKALRFYKVSLWSGKILFGYILCSGISKFEDAPLQCETTPPDLICVTHCPCWPLGLTGISGCQCSSGPAPSLFDSALGRNSGMKTLL